jgi:hypothetical protein
MLDVANLTMEDVAALAARLQPHLGQAPAAALTVRVAKCKKMGNTGGSVLAWADLTFVGGGTELMTVTGFKLLQRTDGNRWLAVPQRKHEKLAQDGTVEKVEWIDTFKFVSKDLADAARHAVKAAYDALPADEIPM